MRICSVISSLGAGGAERVLLELCGAWAARGDEVTLVTLSAARDDHYDVPAGVVRVALDMLGASHRLRAVGANVGRLRALRQAVLAADPEVVVSFVDRTNVRTLLATAGLRVPVVVSERIDPRHHDIGRAWSLLRGLTYPHADALVVQTTGLRAWGAQHLPAPRVFAIPNPVRPVHRTPTPMAARSRDVVVMGRMVAQKGFDVAIRAFALVQARHPGWRLRLVGDGPDRGALEALASTMLPAEAFAFHGRTADPDAVLAAAPLFVLSSRYEGFPNVLLEAMQAGCACIATDCPSGPADMIDSGTNGLLVPNESVAALADALHTALGDEGLRTRLGAEAAASVSRYGLATVLTQWDEAFDVAGAVSVRRAHAGRLLGRAA